MAFEQEIKDKKDKIEQDIKLLEEQLDKENKI